MFCFVAFGLDLGVVFLSEFGRRKESVCMWVFFSFFLRSGIVFLGVFFFLICSCILVYVLVVFFKTNLDLNSYDF